VPLFLFTFLFGIASSPAPRHLAPRRYDPARRPMLVPARPCPHGTRHLIGWRLARGARLLRETVEAWR